MAMIKILNQCQEGVFFMSKLSKELIRQIIADGEFSTPKDIGEYIKDMFKLCSMKKLPTWYKK